MALTKEEQLELEQLQNDPDLKHMLEAESENLGYKPESSMLEAAARSGAQALTFNTADEIAAALEAATSAKPYEQALEESRKEYEKSEKDYPITSALGGLGGGIAQAALITGLTGGAGAPAEAAAVAGKGSKALQLMRSALLPSVEKGALQNIGSAALTGSTMGALGAVGGSEREGLERLKDAPTGAVVGGTLGAAAGTVLEGLGATGKAVGKKISEKIDKGELPDFFKQVRTGLSLGERNLGTITPKDKKIIREQAIKAAEEFMPPIESTIREVGQLKNKILSNVPSRIDLKPEVDNLVNDLRVLGRKESIKLADEIQFQYLNKLKQLSESNRTVTLGDWDGFVREVEEILRKKKARGIGSVKKLRYQYTKSMKDKITNSVDSPTALAALAQDKEALDLYSKYLNTLSPRELLSDRDALSTAMVKAEDIKGMASLDATAPFSFIKSSIKKPTQLTEEQALESSKNVMDLIKTVKTIAEKEDPSITGDIVKSNIKNILDQSSDEVVQNSNPLKMLNKIINKVSTASEFMGVKRNKELDSGDLKTFEDFKKVFKSVLQLSDDREVNIANQMKYNKAIDYLKQAFPEMAQKVENEIGKAVDDLQFLRYTQEGALDTPIKEAGVIKSAMGNIGQYMASGANILSQVRTSAQKGEMGIIPGASTAIRPGVSVINTLKWYVDNRLEASPNNPVLKTLSQKLEAALLEKDEGRRAAMINVLMQYSPIRKIMEEKKKSEEKMK